MLLCEVLEEATYVRHHQKKNAFLFSVMRHFTEYMKEKYFTVRYVKFDDAENTGSLEGEVKRAFTTVKVSRLIFTESGEYRLLQKFKSWPDSLGIVVDNSS